MSLAKPLRRLHSAAVPCSWVDFYIRRMLKAAHASLVFLFLATIDPQIAHAQASANANVAGRVRDDSGAAIPGVTVSLSPTAGGGASVEVTAVDGTFRFRSLAAGEYGIDAALDGFKGVSKRVRLTPGQRLEIEFTLVPAFGETVEVVADSSKSGEVAILEERRQAAVVGDSISAEEIRKTPDANAAGVVERLTGVSLVGDKYVFVRGLGERYSGTTINGSAMPTTETEKRVVPLDLFPAKLLDNVNVVKTYTPDRPGDFGSGMVEMTTTQFPSSQTLRLTIGGGYQSGTTGNHFRRYGSGLSRFGGGGQPMPASIPTSFVQRRGLLQPNGFTADELQTIGRSLVGDWSGTGERSIGPSTDVALTYGSSLGRFGLVLSAVSNHGFDNAKEAQRFFGVDEGDVLTPINDYQLTTDRENVTAGFVGNLSARLTDNNRLFFNSVLTRDASSEYREQEGLQTNSGGDIRDYRVRYQIEKILSQTLRGEHNIAGPGLGSLVEWRLARSAASNGSDLRENIYRESDPGVFSLQVGFADSGKIEYFDLDDEVREAGISYSVFFARGGRFSGTIKGGAAQQRRTRSFAARRFRFTTPNAQQFDLTGTPESVYAVENIRPGAFEIREFTGINDAYDASHDVDAGFLMADVTRGRWRVISGARYESSDQRVATFNPFDTRAKVESIHEQRDVLPSLNVVYALQPRANLRFAYGRSVNRPEFRELSPFAFTELAGGRSVAGNPELVQATLDSLDMRWEMFPASGEVVAASAFFKLIDKPIERVVQPTSDYRLSFVNAENARLYGVEIEFRRSLGSFVRSLQNWSVNANYARIKSEVSVGKHQYSVVTSTSRPLEGQSDDVGNLALQYSNPRRGAMFRVMGSYSGPRLTESGAFGLPDTYEQSFTSFDAVVSQSLAPRLEVKLAATNLLNARREFTQRSAIQRLIDPGRKFSLSLNYSPF